MTRSEALAAAGAATTPGTRDSAVGPGADPAGFSGPELSGPQLSALEQIRRQKPRREGPGARYVATRALHAVFVVAVAYLLTYWVLFALPGDPVRNRLENPQNPVPPEQAEVIIAYYNLDKPSWEQFLITVGRLFRGDLGYSLGTGRSVTDLFLQGIGSTLVLSALALVVAVVVALIVALAAVFLKRRAARTLFASLPPLALATPSFLIGLILLHVFSYRLGWVSALDTDSLGSLVLPAVALGIAVSPSVTQVLIQGLEHVQTQPFVKILRSKGLPESTIVGRHLLRNGALPALTLLALTVADLIAGSVIIETVFNRAGLGFITEDAVRSQDGPVVLAVVLFVAVLYSVVNLITDLIYPVIDPRIKLTESRVGGRRSPANPSARGAAPGTASGPTPASAPTTGPALTPGSGTVGAATPSGTGGHA